MGEPRRRARVSRGFGLSEKGQEALSSLDIFNVDLPLSTSPSLSPRTGKRGPPRSLAPPPPPPPPPPSPPDERPATLSPTLLLSTTIEAPGKKTLDKHTETPSRPATRWRAWGATPASRRSASTRSAWTRTTARSRGSRRRCLARAPGFAVSGTSPRRTTKKAKGKGTDSTTTTTTTGGASGGPACPGCPAGRDGRENPDSVLQHHRLRYPRRRKKQSNTTRNEHTKKTTANALLCPCPIRQTSTFFFSFFAVVPSPHLSRYPPPPPPPPFLFLLCFFSQGALSERGEDRKKWERVLFSGLFISGRKKKGSSQTKKRKKHL